MKVQIFIILGIAVSATVALPNHRARRDDASSTASSCSTDSDNLGDLLISVGNILDNIIENLGDIEIVASNRNNTDKNQLYFIGLLSEVIGFRDFMSALLQSGSVEGDTNQTDVLSSLIEDTSSLLDSLLGSGTSGSYACPSGGLLSGLLQTLTDDNIIQVLTSVISTLNPTIRSMLSIVPRL